MTRIRPSIRISFLMGTILLLLAARARPESPALVTAPPVSSVPLVVADLPTDTGSPTDTAGTPDASLSQSALDARSESSAHRYKPRSQRARALEVD